MKYTEPSKTERIPKVKRVIRIEPHLRRKTIIYRNKSLQIEHKINYGTFDRNNNLIMSNVKELNTNNEEFYKHYHTIQSKSETQRIIENFSDIIQQYKLREYKIPDLSIKRNIFNPNPLLLPEGKVYEYYSYLKNKDNKKLKFFKKFGQRKKDKALQFIEKENKELQNKIVLLKKTDRYESKKRSLQKEFPKTHKESFIDVMIRKEKEKNIFKENKELYKKNQEIKNIIPKVRITFKSINVSKLKKDYYQNDPFQQRFANIFHDDNLSIKTQRTQESFFSKNRNTRRRSEIGKNLKKTAIQTGSNIQEIQKLKFSDFLCISTEVKQICNEDIKKYSLIRYHHLT